MADVFISYSRKDKDFVRALHAALVQQNRETWVDWEDIPLTADWWQEIQSGIEAADTFVFVVSPDSIASKVCREEIDHAVKCHKRLVPIVHREGFDTQQIHPALAKHNWLFFRAEDNFEQAFRSLVTAIDTDLEYVKQHTRMLVRAIEWETQNRNSDLLLRGSELTAIVQRLSDIEAKEPRPTGLQRAYVMASLEVENARQTLEIRRQRNQTIGVAVFSIFSLSLAAYAFQQRGYAIQQRQVAYEQNKIAFARQLASQANRETSQENALLRQENLQAAQGVLTLKLGLDALPANALALLSGLDPKIVELSPDGNYIAAIGADTTLLVWHVTSGNLIFSQKQRQTVKIKFSPDSQLLTCARADGSLEIWKVAPQAFESIREFRAHSQTLTAIAFSSNGEYLATASRDRTVSVWSLDGTLMYRLSQSRAVSSVAFSPDARKLVTASNDPIARVWDSKTGQQIACLQHEQDVRLVAFNQNGEYLGTVSGDTIVRVFSQGAIEESGKTQC
ncbi:toll/interleukin-1 receptor domain-containing protein [Phormidesmis sp. 146-12]